MSKPFTFYEGFSAGQLAADPYFRQWVILSLPEDYQYWNTYLQQYPDQQDTVLAARVIVIEGFDSKPVIPLSAEEKASMRSQLVEKLYTEIPEEKPVRNIRRRVIQVAAIVAGLAIGVTALYKKPAPVVYAIVEKTGQGETRKIILDDSSEVVLNANSTLRYSSNLADAAIREVSLEGNAFFAIRKKADHRGFEVHSNGLSVAVLGTEFNVNARSNKTEVVLTSGKVKLSDLQTDQPLVIMHPGEKVQFDPATKTFTKKTIDLQLYESWANGSWHFSSTSLQEITQLIYACYGVETVFADEKTRNLKINAVIPVTDLKSFLKVISRTLDITISQKDNQIIIHQ